MRKFASLFTMLMLFSALAFGQNRQISGTVTDQNGAAVSGASVTLKGTPTGVSADNNGRFSILAKTGDVLVISGVGITTPVEATVGTGSTVAVSVTISATTGTEVVVTALGIQRQRRELGYATAKVNNELLTQASPVNAANGLQGKISGVNIATMDNSVFENVKINIRGIRSLTGNNDPLLLLDGVQTQLSYFSSINPNDIVDINVLKGSSAAAIYGPDARNGVIVVTTKKGTRNDNIEIGVSRTQQYSKVSFYPEFQNQFGSGGYGAYVEYENWSWGDAFDGSMRPLGSTLVDGSQLMVPYVANNSRKKFFNTAITSQTDVSINARDMFLSVQDVNLSGIVPGDKNKRTSLRFNANKEYGKLKVNMNVNYIRSDYEIFDDAGMAGYFAAQNVGNNSGLLNLIFNTPAQVPLKRFKDWRNDKFSGFDTYFNHYGLNPYMAIDTWREDGRRNELLANLELNYKLFKSFNVTWRVGSTFRDLDRKSTSTGQIQNPAINVNTNTTIPGYVSENSITSARLSSEVFGNFTKTYGKFKVNAIAGTYVRQQEGKAIGISNTNLAIPGLLAVTNLVGNYAGGDGNAYTRTRLFSVFGSVSVGFDNWLNVEITGRNDKVSWLAPDRNSYFYPGVSAAAVLTDVIPGIKGKALNYMKLRASWNKTGNADAVAPYALNPIFNPGGGFPYGPIAGYTAGNGITDPNINPEFIESFEVGTEMTVWNNKATIGVTYYKSNNTDQIIGVQVSPSTGYTNTQVNAASFENKGFEFDLALTPLVKLGDWRINFTANAHYNTSNVNSIYPGLDRIFIGGFNNVAANYAVVGFPAMTFLVKDYNRDDQGRIIVSTTTGLPSINPNTIQMGRTAPKWTVGLSPTVAWKGLTITAVAEYKTGHLAYGRIGNEMTWTGVAKATAYNNRERFVVPNSVYWDGTKYVENTNITVNDVNNFYINEYSDAETNFMYDASSWRIREVSISYSLPKKIFGNGRFIKGANVTASGRNLFLWVPKSNQYTDPDFNFDGGNSNGVTTSQINPPTRTMGVSVNLTF